MAQVQTRRAYRAERAAAAAADAGAGSRAGRNLPAATAVGIILGIVIVGTLLTVKSTFLIVVVAAIGIGAWELVEAARSGRIHAPLVPVMTGAVSIVPIAYLAGPEGLMLGFGLTCLAILLWRAVDGLGGAVRDIAGGVFITAYVPLLAGFVALMLAEPDGHLRVLIFVVVTVMSDIGGYAVGVLFGRHPMAPSVSPKKSWEGFAGSVVWCAVAGVLTVTLMLDASWWVGLLVGLAVAVTATVGDLAESTIKRDLGIKDMGSVLPGHGGLMDRLDSLLVVAPVVWLLLTVGVPA